MSAPEEPLQPQDCSAPAPASEPAIEAIASPAAAPEPASETPHEGSFHWGEAAHSLLMVLVIAIFIISFIAQEFVIPSASMERTLLVGDFVLVDKTRFAPHEGAPDLLPYRPIEHGDVIVFFYPEGAHEHFVKRVVGVPGDRLRLLGKRLYRNGLAINESYTQHVDARYELFRDNFPYGAHDDGQLSRHWRDSIDSHLINDEVVVPPHSYFVLGDNRDDSLDSRYWGFVPEQNIVGRPLLIYWSMRMRPVDDDDDDDAPRKANFSSRLHMVANAARSLATGIRINRFFNVIR